MRVHKGNSFKIIELASTLNALNSIDNGNLTIYKYIYVSVLV